MCAQRTDANNQRQPNELVRLGRRMTTYGCGGELSGVIYRQQRWITLTVKHQEQHEPHSEDEHPSTPIEIQEFITTHAHQLTSGDLFAQVQRQFGYNITRAQMYYWKSQALFHLYRRVDDQMVSSRILVREYLDAGFREIRPEINAIKQTWGDNILRLCLWHLKRTVRLALKKSKGSLGPIYEVDIDDVWGNLILQARCPEEDIKAISEMMEKHYCYHQRIPRACAREMYEYCVRRSLPDAWAYLWRQWYTERQWVLWARYFLAYIILAKHCEQLFDSYNHRIILRRDPPKWESCL
ncbi:hypothetical protein BC941DRAFT_445395 [Chlamydoabsidia padenii]|nr:hypothetical protein BC941DRAFT_445395 [Chlamydoabsidia padenii]